MSKEPKQSGTQTVTSKMVLPDWLDSGYQNAAGAAANLFQGGNPAVAQAQQAYDAAQQRYNNQSSMRVPQGWRFDPSGSGVMAADGIHNKGGYRRLDDMGNTEWMDPQLAGMYSGGNMGGSADMTELNNARAALEAAKAQPWDESQDPLWQHKLDFSGPTKMGMQNILDIAGSGVNDNAFDLYNNTLQGDYLYGGDGFNAAYDAASRRITPQVTGAFNAAGRMGGGAGADELGGRLGDAFAGLYNNERQRQMGALSMAPAMDLLAYEPARRQLQVGAMHDAKNIENRGIDFANRNMDSQRLDQYLSRLGGIAPNFRGEQSSQPIYSQGGGIGSLLGPALTVAGMFSGNPFAGLGGSLGMGATGSMNMGGLLGGFQGF